MKSPNLSLLSVVKCRAGQQITRYLQRCNLVWVISLLGIAASLGCSFNSVKPPAVSLVDVRFGEVTLFETTLVARVRVENENKFPVTVDGGVHRIYLNDIDIGRGLSDERIELGRYGATEQQLTIRLSNVSMLRQIEPLIQSEEFEYRIESSMHMVSPSRSELELVNRGRLGPSSFGASRSKPRGSLTF